MSNIKLTQREANVKAEQLNGIGSMDDNHTDNKSTSYLETLLTEEDHLPIPELSLLIRCFVVAAVAIVCFWSSQFGAFVFDDTEAVLKNKDLLPDSPLQNLLEHDFWGKNITSKTSHKSYRPFTVLTFRWSYYLAGDYLPRGFHVVNILLHVLNSVVSLFLFNVLCSGVFYYGKSNVKRCPKLSLVAALLFTTHPIHTESVAGVVGRADLLCCLFFMAAFLSYAKWCWSHQSGFKGSASWRWSLLFVTSATLAMLSKEQGITVIGVCIAYDAILVSKIHPHSILQLFRNPKHSDKNMGLRQFVYRIAISSVSAALLLMCRWWVMGSTTPTFQPGDNPSAFVDGIILRVLNYNYIYSLNCWLLLSPWWLCFDWAMGCVPLIETVLDGRIVFPFMMWSGLLLLAWTCYTLDTQSKRVVAMAACLVVIPFLPATNLLFHVGFVVAERVLYIPCAGYCLLVTVGFGRLCQYESMRKIAPILLGSFVVLNTARCIHRSFDWTSEETLFVSGKSVCPLNAKVHYNVGKILSNKGDEHGAIVCYNEAIRLRPTYDEALNNLGNLLKGQGILIEAEEYLERAINASPSFAAAWMNLGTVKSEMKKVKEAEKCLFNAITHRKNYPDAYYNLGNLYIDTKNHDRALEMFQKAISQNPLHIRAWQNGVLLLSNEDRTDEALRMAHQGLEQMPRAASLYFNIGNMLGKQDKLQEAEGYFLKALDIDPNQSTYHGNIGVVYHQLKAYDKAQLSYSRALQLDPNNASALDNLKKLERAMKRSKNKQPS